MEQLDIFGLMGVYATPAYEPAELVQGVKAWMVEPHLYKRPYDERAYLVRLRARQVEIEEDSRREGDGWTIALHTCDGGPHMSAMRTIRAEDVFFRRKPGWADMLRWWQADADETTRNLVEPDAMVVNWEG